MAKAAWCSSAECWCGYAMQYRYSCAGRCCIHCWFCAYSVYFWWCMWSNLDCETKRHHSRPSTRGELELLAYGTVSKCSIWPMSSRAMKMTIQLCLIVLLYTTGSKHCLITEQQMYLYFTEFSFEQHLLLLDSFYRTCISHLTHPGISISFSQWHLFIRLYTRPVDQLQWCIFLWMCKFEINWNLSYYSASNACYLIGFFV